MLAGTAKGLVFSGLGNANLFLLSSCIILSRLREGRCSSSVYSAARMVRARRQSAASLAEASWEFTQARNSELEASPTRAR
jgi:hypothetical protein